MNQHKNNELWVDLLLLSFCLFCCVVSRSSFCRTAFVSALLRVSARRQFRFLVSFASRRVVHCDLTVSLLVFGAIGLFDCLLTRQARNLTWHARLAPKAVWCDSTRPLPTHSTGLYQGTPATSICDLDLRLFLDVMFFGKIARPNQRWATECVLKVRNEQRC